MGHDQGPNCLQRLSEDDTSRSRVTYLFLVSLFELIDFLICHIHTIEMGSPIINLRDHKLEFPDYDKYLQAPR